MNEKKYIVTADCSFVRIWRKLMVTISKSSFLHCKMRLVLLKWGGNFEGNAFVGANVTFDAIPPELITVGSGAIIMAGTCILSHFYSMKDCIFYLGKVIIGKNVFIGMNTLIVNSVEIGDNAVIGAGSVVTCDIPGNEVWAGNPARFIKSRV